MEEKNQFEEDMRIDEIIIEPLDDSNEVFLEMVSMVCCGTQGGHACGCGPTF